MADGNRKRANVIERFVNDQIVSLTLREMRSRTLNPRFSVALGGVIVVLSIAGPFDTFGALSLPERFFYWSAVAIGSYGVGFFISMLTTLRAEQCGMPSFLAPFLGGVIAGVPVAALNAAIIGAVFGSGTPGFWFLLPYVTAISVVISVLSGFLAHGGADEAAAGKQPADLSGSVLLENLPLRLGRDIVHLRAQDHYVEVTTPRGSALVLMRIGDVERDPAGVDGVRTHRSWWVSGKHAVRLRRGDGKLRVVTSLGTEVPVGRAYRDRVLRFLEGG